MLSRRRMLVTACCTATMAVSSGVAWAATAPPARPRVVDMADPGTTASSSTVDVNTTGPDGTTSSTETTAPDATSTTTAPADTTTTTGDTSTTTDAPTTTTTSPASSSTTIAPVCKPGWGYGDTNHCHSGPPGLTNRPGHPKHVSQKP